MLTSFTFTLLIIVCISTVPIIVLLMQYFLAGFHSIRNHYAKCQPYFPRVAILIPSWNEGEVLHYSLERLMQMDYPLENLRCYVIDDASHDHTPQVVQEKMQKFPDNIFYIRRNVGGEGKAHTLNAGLKTALADDWAQAILIIDADIVFNQNALQRMTRHLADPLVGAVTAYIEVMQLPGNFLTHSISSEYILAQAIARRSQNATKALACLAGGAQLHTRDNIEAIGGQINTATLAEDTYTTFLTQIHGRRALFEGNAIVHAEEPETLLAFWKQRFRWSRGNLQITRAFKDIWFRRHHPSHLGGIFFGLTWFSTLLMPFSMILTSISLILLLLINPTYSWEVLRVFYLLSATSYLFSTLLSFAIDPYTMRKAWLSSLLFPGFISFGMMAISFIPLFIREFSIESIIANYGWAYYVLLFMNAWVALCMLASWLMYRLAKLGLPEWMVRICLGIVGYGPLLCTITFLAAIAECRHSTIKWDKTVKPPIKEKKLLPYHPMSYEALLTRDIKRERRFLRDEILIIVFMFFILVLLPFIYNSTHS